MYNLQQASHINCDFASYDTSQRGGILTYASVSGVDVGRYHDDGYRRRPIGIQLFDVEYGRPRKNIRDVVSQFDQFDVLRKGQIVTPWILKIGLITPMDTAFVGPSGLITNSSSFGGDAIGKFLSFFIPKSSVLVYRGLGENLIYTDPNTKQVVYENRIEDRVFINSDGYATVKIDI